LHEKLYNENTGLYSDYAGFQYKPEYSSKLVLSEPYTWRDDLTCGYNVTNYLGFDATCSRPIEKDGKDSRRCCKLGYCITDPQCECIACKYSSSIDDKLNHPLLNQFTSHFGIVSLFPVMFGLVEDRERAENVFRQMADRNGILSNYGLRSLSQQDVLFHQGDNYWRGAVWINVNYLTLKGLYMNYLDLQVEAPLYSADSMSEALREEYKDI